LEEGHTTVRFSSLQGSEHFTDARARKIHQAKSH